VYAGRAGYCGVGVPGLVDGGGSWKVYSWPDRFDCSIVLFWCDDSEVQY